MLGFMLTKEEKKEIEYILKRELEELLFDFEDERIHDVVKKAMEERYKIIFCLFRRVANAEECIRYVRKKNFLLKSVDADSYYMIN
ncbi:hypothetical protein ACT7CT_28795 [Bacillus sanguinis]